jgi:peptidyl-tRNA hydrolase, PTH1 family
VLVVGLGNPGGEYLLTRHNAGFRAVDVLVAECSGTWKSDRKFSAEIADIRLKSHGEDIRVKVIKPLLYMNRSGGPVKSVYQYYRSFVDDNFDASGLKREGYAGLPIVVVYDDLDFDPGVVKVKTGGSAGGHNGVSDMIRHLSRNDFLRVRIGIGHPRYSETPEMSVSDWVLSIPKGQDFEKIEDGVRHASSIVTQVVTEGVHSVKY